MRIALIGLPQAGKKTLFHLLTGRTVPESRKPGEAVEGVAPIRDERVDRLSEICRPQKTTYAENHFVLCPDASTDSSDRQWLEAARRCDLLCLVVRAFESELVYHPRGSVDAARDREQLEAELLLADMALVDTRLERIEKDKRSKKAGDAALEEAVLRKCMQALEDSRPVREAGLDAHELKAIRSLGLLTLLPSLCAYNVSEDDVASDSWAGKLAVSALIEEEIAAMDDPAERREYLESLGLAASGVERVNAAAYDALGLMSFYTIGPDEARAWTIRKGATAPEAGGKIHSDIQRGFIRVEVIKFDDLMATGSEKAARDAGLVQTRGRDYVMQDGDVCHFLFNV